MSKTYYYFYYTYYIFILRICFRYVYMIFDDILKEGISAVALRPNRDVSSRPTSLPTRRDNARRKKLMQRASRRCDSPLRLDNLVTNSRVIPGER